MVLLGLSDGVYAGYALEQLKAGSGYEKAGAGPVAAGIKAVKPVPAQDEKELQVPEGRYQEIRKPLDPVPSGYYGGKLFCNTKWVMFVTDSPEDTGTVTVDNFTSFPANQVLMLEAGSVWFTLRQGLETASFEVVLDHLMADNAQTGLYNCRLKMPSKDKAAATGNTRI
jgi:hypothetical protein